MLSRAVVDSILKQYATGASTRAVAATHGISESKVSTVLREQGTPVRHRMITDEIVVQARELYEAGVTLPEVAAALGVSLSPLNAAFTKRGIPRRGRWGKRRA